MIIEDEAIVISISEYSENKRIIKCLTQIYGLCTGISRIYKKKRNINIASIVKIRWKARLQEHMGQIEIEDIEDIYGSIFIQKEKILFLSLITSTLASILFEKNPDLELYNEVKKFLNILKYENNLIKVLTQYALFEAKLLSLMGYGFDFSVCAVSKQPIYYEAFISPNTGNVVSKEVALPYISQLYQVPNFWFLDNKDSIKIEEISDSLKITKHFIEKFNPNFYMKKELNSIRAMVLKIYNASI